MKRLTVLMTAIFAVLALTGFAQKKGTIKFESMVHDFGQIKEDGGFVTCSFKLTNTGNDTLKIINVKPGCGCTTSNWTKEAIKPGGKGFVDATFDPRNRPGEFAKGIAITTNDPDNQNVSLTIKGTVLPRQKSYTDLYPTKLGNLRFESSQLNLQNVKNIEVRTDTMKIYNDWKQNMTLEIGKDMPAYMTAKVIPETLKPGKEGMIIITYDAKLKNDFGYLYDRININTNDSAQAQKTLSISLNIVEDFSSLTPEQLAKAPKVVFTTTTYEFPNVKQGDKVDYSYEFRNDGENDLIIRKTKASCGCTATTPEKSILKKGESSNIKISFNTAGKEGKQHKTVTVITNDPNNSSVTLNITGTVDKPAQ
jgi:hypothetical protein